MVTNLSREEFFRNLADSGLFTQEEVGRVCATLPEVQAPEGEAAARELIAAGKLTAFQADAVRERRFEGLVIGNYEVLDRLGEGGMGTVFKARHRRMRRLVAIKVLSRQVARSERFIKRFQREVEAVARLSHPNIVMAYDADEADVGHFLVMEFVNGRDLASEVQQHGPLPVRQAVACIVQAGWALEYAHRQGIIHRDIKPANLLLDASNVVKVADLGLARFDEAHEPPEDASALTQAGTIMGTVDFMPPEQALGLTSIDHRADVYSLGCTLYFLLRGKPPYQGSTLMATLLKHREAPIPSLMEERPEISAELDAVFRRMVAKAPADRYQTMSDVVRALEAVEASLRDQPSGEGMVLQFEGSGSGGSTGVWESQKTAADIAPPAASQTVDLALPATGVGLALKVLLVEPSRTQAAIIRKYLQAQGVEQVTPVTTGQAALQAVRNECPDVVLSAQHLSDMTGVHLAEQINRECKAAAPGFVLISSESESAETESLSKCGKVILLKKPFTAEQVGNALKVVAPGQSPPPAVSAAGHLRVLIVDDSAAARLHVRGVLVRFGLSRFVEATDGAHAVAALAGGTFDLIVTDYNMPHMDGRALVGFLKANPATAAIPIIMVTTEDNPGKLEAVRRLGVAAVCDKSFPPEVVRTVLANLVQPQ